MSKLLVGLTAGILIGVLLAPDKGSETRRKLREQANDLKDQFNDFIDNLGNKAEDVAEDVDEFASQAKPQYQ